jgi:N-acetylmuramoyl-L-alanine amidase
MNIKQVPSPNCTPGRKKYRPEAIVIHIMEGSLAGTDEWFRNRASKVSAHYGIGRSGDVHQYVSEMDSAWHAGRVNDPSWAGIRSAGKGLYINPNYYSIGIEHEGQVNTEWTDALYQTSATLIRAICTRWNIPIDRDHIIGHHEIYSLKTCPGNKVDLNKLITLAGGKPAPAMLPPAADPQLVTASGKVVTRARLNLRPQPDTKSAPIRTVDENIQLAYEGYTTEGESVRNSSKWYYTKEGAWFWGGAVEIQSDTPSFIKVTGNTTTPTLEQLRNATGARATVAASFLPYIQETCRRYGIDTPARQLCFLAQVGHESGGLHYTEELASGKAYEGREDLGNTQEGDGIRFKGRGLIQITGRSNYEALARAFSIDLVAHPEKLGARNSGLCSEEQLLYAALSAGWFWHTNSLNAFADAIDIRKPIDEDINMKQFKGITRRINGGYNGLQDRVQKYQNGVSYFTQTG